MQCDNPCRHARVAAKIGDTAKNIDENFLRSRSSASAFLRRIATRQTMNASAKGIHQFLNACLSAFANAPRPLRVVLRFVFRNRVSFRVFRLLVTIVPKRFTRDEKPPHEYSCHGFSALQNRFSQHNIKVLCRGA
jgi:hypothetical protein